MKPRPPASVGVGHAKVLDALADHIDKVLDHYSEFGFSTDWKPAQNSPLKWEEKRLERQFGPGTVEQKTYWRGTSTARRTVKRARYWDDSAAGRAAESCLLLTSLSAQYLEGLRVLLNERQVIFAPAPLARSVFEIAGYVAWLLDPKLSSVRDRAARSTLAHLGDMTRAKAATTLLGHPNAPKIGGAVRKLRREEIPALFYPSEIERGDESDPCPACGARPKSELRLRHQHQP